MTGYIVQYTYTYICTLYCKDSLAIHETRFRMPMNQNGNHVTVLTDGWLVRRQMKKVKFPMWNLFLRFYIERYCHISVSFMQNAKKPFYDDLQSTLVLKSIKSISVWAMKTSPVNMYVINMFVIKDVRKILPARFSLYCPIETRDNLARSEDTVLLYSSMRTQ